MATKKKSETTPVDDSHSHPAAPDNRRQDGELDKRTVEGREQEESETDTGTRAMGSQQTLTQPAPIAQTQERTPSGEIVTVQYVREVSAAMGGGQLFWVKVNGKEHCQVRWHDGEMFPIPGGRPLSQEQRTAAVFAIDEALAIRSKVQPAYEQAKT